MLFPKENYDSSRKLGLCGYDDIEQASMLPIPLTTVSKINIILGKKQLSITKKNY